MLEILAPSGNEECAEVAIACGANAIYLGYTAFSARDSAANFDEVGLQRILQKAHFAGVKVYVAMNTVVKTAEIDGFLSTLLKLWTMGADAIILQDMLLGKYIHALYPQIVLHLSTQAGICTQEGAMLAKEYGFSRVILARETPLYEIEKIAKIVETEVFVQGALCTAYSGQCYFSSFVGGNSGNRGRCKQPCRKKYTYNRNGFEEYAYALSLSDLCVGEEIAKLIAAGVVSFKIEGRMRRKEYVGAAVRYYRQILDGEPSQVAFSDLKRTYNRGNYTKGLTFGQDKRFLSRSVQGHLGKNVGVVKVEKGRYLVESRFSAKQGDAFKILRDGKEVGGAAYAGNYARGFILFTKERLRNGDSVFITTDTDVNARVVQGKAKPYEVRLRLRFAEGERAQVVGNGVSVFSENLLQSATTSPLTKADIQANFLKTDGLPIEVFFDEIQVIGNVFMPKSALNAFRRAFYDALGKCVACDNRSALSQKWEERFFCGKNNRTAVISNDFTGICCDVGIYKPNDYTAPIDPAFLALQGEKYLYLPPFHTEKDVLRIQELVKENRLDGIYAENYDGISIAQGIGCRLFAGTGFNLTNPLAISQIFSLVSYYAVSKELSETEMRPLISEKAFVLSSGDVKLMDLCYCPFGKTCRQCDKKETYRLTDENGRVFPVRRYVGADGGCRFEVYNCASLIGRGVSGAGQLMDVSVQADKVSAVKAINNEQQQKQVYSSYTAGHIKNGVL